MHTITLTNDFHNTSVVVRVSNERVRMHDTDRDRVLDVFLSDSQTRRAQRTLCGHVGCTCSGVTGTRGGVPAYQLSRV
jgi:hypothetical protein